MNAEQAISHLQNVVRRQQKALSTESIFVFWLRRYMHAIPGYPEELTSEQKLERFLTELARDRGISAVSQNQAFNAILFFYRHDGSVILGNVEHPVAEGSLVHIPPGVVHGARGRVRVLVVGIPDVAEDDYFAADER